MIIRKEYSVESAHIVRNCTSHRCSHSIHGHSAKIELFFESCGLDNAQMVMDFGLMKDHVKQLVDAMDHCYLLCSKDKEEFKQFIQKNCDRFIILPFNPSAEMLSVFVFHYISKILENTMFVNGENGVSLKAVRYHETATGYAECGYNDYLNLWKDYTVYFSEGCREDMSKPLQNMVLDLPTTFIHPTIQQQIDL